MSSDLEPTVFEAFWQQIMNSPQGVLLDLMEIEMPGFKDNLKDFSGASFDLGYITAQEKFQKP